MLSQTKKINLTREEVVIILYYYNAGYEYNQISLLTGIAKQDVILTIDYNYTPFKAISNYYNNKLNNSIQNFIQAYEMCKPFLSMYPSYDSKKKASLKQLESINIDFFINNKSVVNIAQESNSETLDIMYQIVNNLFTLDNKILKLINKKNIDFGGFKENYYSLLTCILEEKTTIEDSLINMGLAKKEEKEEEEKKQFPPKTNLNYPNGVIPSSIELTEQEQEYILENRKEMSVFKMAQTLNRSPQKIKSYLRKVHRLETIKSK